MNQDSKDSKQEAPTAAALEESKFYSFVGYLNYIDKYKRLHFHVHDPLDSQLKEHKNLLTKAQLKNIKFTNGKGPISLYNQDNKDYVNARLNLSKYEKPNISKYESLLKKLYFITAERIDYESTQYGSGSYFVLIKYTLIKK